MNSMTWGLCAPATVPSIRRTRTLQLNEIAARFNQLAVPGLGGVWFARQIVMALQGVWIARQLNNGTSNIEAANAIEALSCWKGYVEGKQRDARLRGFNKIRKLHAKDLTFNAARKRTFYVTIPMRMGTVEALPALGFVTPQRSFNAFDCTATGEQLLRLDKGQQALFTRWIAAPDSIASKAVQPSYEALSSDACQLIRSQLQHAGSETDSQRRSAALAWMDRLRQSRPARIRWEKRPAEITVEHWHDLQAGAYFFATRAAALDLLERLEVEMAQHRSGVCHDLRSPLSPPLLDAIQHLRQRAQAFLLLQHPDAAARQFCHECDQPPAAVLRALVKRDGHILKLNAEQIEPGNAFRGNSAADTNQDEDAVEPPSAQDFWPEHLSRRMHNLFLLNLDLHGELSAWLDKGKVA